MYSNPEELMRPGNHLSHRSRLAIPGENLWTNEKESFRAKKDSPTKNKGFTRLVIAFTTV